MNSSSLLEMLGRGEFGESIISSYSVVEIHGVHACAWLGEVSPSTTLEVWEAYKARRRSEVDRNVRQPCADEKCTLCFTELERLKRAAFVLANVVDTGERDPSWDEGQELEEAAIQYGRWQRGPEVD